MQLTPHLSAVCLSVSDPAQLAQFYAAHLGMTAQQVSDGWQVGYTGEDANLMLCPGGDAYEHDRQDRYWKIGITLPNVDIAHAQLRKAGVTVSDPHQFGQIGYMCHLSDPAGHQIELLQHDFQGNRPTSAGDQALPMGGGARIGQITLRTGDIKAEAETAAALGMHLLSIQPVEDYGFDLYFWAFSSDTPPHRDLRSAENREWLWKRPYTTLEFQHVPGLTPRHNPGFAGLKFGDDHVTDFAKTAAEQG